MKKIFVLFFLLLFSLSTFAQKPRKKSPPRPASAAASNSTAKIGTEKEEFEKAVAVAGATQRIAALRKFVANFPESAEKTRALELVTSARAEAADERLQAGDSAAGIALFKSAVEETPEGASDKLYADVILRIPTNLFFRGERAAAADIARLIEAKSEGNAKQLLGLATYYLGIENGDEAKRLAEKAVALDANLPAAYQTLGLANRLNFNLEDAANAYSKALELDSNSAVSKRSLAEMKRALGRSGEAVALYREITEKNPADALAASGLILALFDDGKRAEAESQLQLALEQNPNNLTLLVGAAYSYAARNETDRTLDLAQKAVALEPRYVWGYVALARAYLHQNRFYDAERALLTARTYGNFPTLDYELATVRAAGGFYREAAQELAKSFAVRDDSINVRLGGRIEKQSKSFIELIAFERRASIFEPLAADDAENAQHLKSLLDFYQKIESKDAANEREIADAAERFVAGDDKMKLHRRLFAADFLLKRKIALPKAAELIKPAFSEVDRALEVQNPSSAVLADELYESRAAAIAKNQLIIVPEVARQTLSSVLRGRIEEISGDVLLETGKAPDAVVRFKRALSVLPEKSVWWRLSQWQLGTALEVDGKSAEALAAYIKSYTSAPFLDASKRPVIEALYEKINGSLDGLDAKIGAKPISIESPLSNAAADATPKPETENQTAQNQTPNANVSTKTERAPQTIAETKTPSRTIAKNAPPIDKTTKPNEAALIEEPTKSKTMPRPVVTNAKDVAESKKTETATKAVTKSKDENAVKSLFEPIIISVPRVENTVKPKADDEPASAEPEKQASDASGKPRPRVIVDGERPAARCELSFSQPSVSLVNNGGNLGILVGFEGDGDAREIRASSSSEADVSVVFEPEIGKSVNRAYFIFKSISRKTGVFTVTFEAPCGDKKDFTVKVR